MVGYNWYERNNITQRMSIKYNVVSKQNPGNRSETKYYATPAPRDEVSFDDFMTRLTNNHHNLRKADVYYLIKCIAEEAGNVLLEGKTLRLDDLGSLHVGFTSEGKNTPTEVRASSIRRSRIMYSASAYLKEVLRTVYYEKAK